MKYNSFFYQIIKTNVIVDVFTNDMLIQLRIKDYEINSTIARVSTSNLLAVGGVLTNDKTKLAVVGVSTNDT